MWEAYKKFDALQQLYDAPPIEEVPTLHERYIVFLKYSS
jgi:hypothetical protein